MSLLHVALSADDDFLASSTHSDIILAPVFSSVGNFFQFEIITGCGAFPLLVSQKNEELQFVYSIVYPDSNLTATTSAADFRFLFMIFFKYILLCVLLKCFAWFDITLSHIYIFF